MLKRAARVTDLTDHPGALAGPGMPKVLIEGLAAAVVGEKTKHICAFPPPSGPHPTNNVVVGSTKVFIGGSAAARVDDTCLCGAKITTGASRVLFG
jgi:uncharacterized Zn-binding protein involved in type VI secretion